MRKIYLGLAAAAVLAVGAYMAFGLARQRALAEVEAVFSALRTDGATATHGAVTFDWRTRGLRIDDIAVVAKGDRSFDLKIATLTAQSLGLGGKTMSASTVELGGVEMAFARVEPFTSRQSYRAPKVLVTDLSAPLTLAPDAAATDATLRTIAALSAFDAASISVPTVVQSVDLTIPTTPGRKADATEITYTHNDVAIERLRAGRIGHLSIGKTDLASKPGSPIVSGTLDSVDISDLDIPPLFGLGLATRTLTDGFVTIQGKTVIGAYTLKIMDGTIVQVDGISGDAFAIDPSKLSYAKIMALVPALTNLGPNPQLPQLADFGTQIISFYQGMRFKAFEVRGLHVLNNTRPMTVVDFGVGRIGVSEFDKGKFGEIAVEAVTSNGSGPGAGVPLHLGRFAVHGFDLVGIFKHALAFATLGPQSFASPPRYFEFLDGFEVVDLSAPNPTTAGTIDIGELKTSWGKLVNGVPTQAQMTSKVTVPLTPTDPVSAILLQSGRTSAALANDTRWNWDEATKTIAVQIEASTDAVGVLSGRLTFGNVPREALSVVPERLFATIPAVEIGSIDVQVHDAGLVELLGKLAASGGGGSPADMLAGVGQQMLNPAQPGQNLAGLLDATGRFVAKPGQTLSLKLVPKAKMSVADAISMASATPGGGGVAAPGGLQGMLEAFTVDAALKP